jgi:hypothetical protein
LIALRPTSALAKQSRDQNTSDLLCRRTSKSCANFVVAENCLRCRSGLRHTNMSNPRNMTVVIAVRNSQP